jgi:hypothetical protein
LEKALKKALEEALKNILYFDLYSHDVKSAQHARYDESMNEVADPPPNARQGGYS